MSRAGPGGRGGPGRRPGPGAGGAPGDPGLARARTSLAWTRTALSFAAIGGVILKRELAAGFVVLALSCVVWLVGRLAIVPGRTGQVRARPAPLLVISIAVTGVAIVALMLALLGPQTAGLRLRP
jgi:uncharacterized membrane protein YidH (DUF202 family)